MSVFIIHFGFGGWLGDGDGYWFACRMMGEDIPLPGVLARCIKDHHPSQFPHLLSVASLISVPLNLEARTGISSLGLSTRLDKYALRNERMVQIFIDMIDGYVQLLIAQ